MDTTVNAVVLGRSEQAGRSGRTVMRVAVAGLMAVLVLCLMSNVADARKVTTTLGQNDFVGACRNGGGTPKRIRTHVVQCTTADGTVVTCDFNTSPATCTIPFKQSAAAAVVPVDGAVLDVAQPEPSGPKVGGIVVAPTDGVLVQAEATPPAEDGQTTTVVAADRAVIVEIEEETP
jgi:hypothetical protein